MQRPESSLSQLLACRAPQVRQVVDNGQRLISGELSYDVRTKRLAHCSEAALWDPKSTLPSLLKKQFPKLGLLIGSQILKAALEAL